MIRILLATLSISLALLSGGPARAAASPPDEAAAVKRTIDGYIVPAFNDLAAAAAKLGPAAHVYCQGPSAATRQSMRAAFLDLLGQWARVDFLRFGPLVQNQRLEQFAYWPDSSGAGARQLRRLLAKPDPALLDPQRLAGASVAIQGLPAFEALMFPDEGGKVDDYSCQLAVAIAGNLVRLSQEMTRGWTGDKGWRSLMLAAGAGNPTYGSPREAANEMLKAALTGLLQLRDQRLMTALGKTAEAVRPDKLPYHRSDGTEAYLAATLGGLAQFVAVFDLPQLAGPPLSWTKSSMEFEFGNVGAGLKRAGSPLSQTIATPQGRAGVVQGLAAIRGLQDLIGVQLAPAAGLSAGFNALDGD